MRLKECAPLAPGAVKPAPAGLRALVAKAEFAPFVLLVGMLVAFTAINPAFLSPTNVALIMGIFLLPPLTRG